MLPISPEEMAQYQATAQRRQQAKRDRLLSRYQLAQAIAAQAAEMLKRDFHATKVVLFGSMLALERVHDRSDLDLAVWGLDPAHYYRAVGRLQGLDARLAIDLIEGESAPLRLQGEISRGRVL